MYGAGDTQRESEKQEKNGAENTSLKINEIKLGKKIRRTNVPISELVPYHKNPKKNNKESVDALARAIEKLGYLKTSITVDENLVLLTGHTTLKALKKLKWDVVPEIDIITGLSEDEKTLYRINDNKLGKIDEWDDELLSELYLTLDDELRSISGFDDSDFGVEKEVEMSYDESIDELSESKLQVELGDAYKLGRHILICGDSTDLFYHKHFITPDIVLTDPPYGIEVVKNKKVGGGGVTKFGGKKGKRIESHEFKEIKNDGTIESAKSFCSMFSDYPSIIFGGNYFTEFLKPSKCWIVWDKENTGKFADVELAWTNFNKGAKLYRWLWNGLSRKGDRAEELKSRAHPTQKPVGLIKNILEDFSKEGDVILDGFAGSGSILIACEATGRTCVCFEIDHEYCEQIIARYEKFTGDSTCKLT